MYINALEVERIFLGVIDLIGAYTKIQSRQLNTKQYVPGTSYNKYIQRIERLFGRSCPIFY